MLDKFKTEEAEHSYIENAIIENVIIPVLDEYSIDYDHKFKNLS